MSLNNKRGIYIRRDYVQASSWGQTISELRTHNSGIRTKGTEKCKMGRVPGAYDKSAMRQAQTLSGRKNGSEERTNP